MQNSKAQFPKQGFSYLLLFTWLHEGIHKRQFEKRLHCAVHLRSVTVLSGSISNTSIFVHCNVWNTASAYC